LSILFVFRPAAAAKLVQEGVTTVEGKSQTYVCMDCVLFSTPLS